MNQEKTEIIDKLGRLFADTFHVDVPSADMDLLDGGVLDSFQFIEFLMQLEQEFAVKVDIADVDLDDLRSLDRMAEIVRGSAPRINGTAGFAGR